MFSFKFYFLASFAFTALVLPAAFVLSQLPGGWKEPPVGPVGRTDFGFVCTPRRDNADMRLWLLGGYKADGLVEDMWSFDLATLKWDPQSAPGFDFDQVGFEVMVDYDQDEAMFKMAVMSGFKYSTNSPTSKIQAVDGMGAEWFEVDAKLDEDEAEPLVGYWSAFGHTSRNEYGHGITRVVGAGGVRDIGFDNMVNTLEFNVSNIHSGIKWKRARFAGDGTEGVNFPSPRYGSCGAKDPSDGNGRRMVIFGGSDREQDHNEVWTLRYGPGPPSTMYQKQVTTGDVPSPRRLSACGFVAPNKFVVVGGYNSQAGGPVADTEAYVLDTTTWDWSIVDGAIQDPAYSAKIATCYFNHNATMRSFLIGGSIGSLEYSNVLYEWKGSADGFQPSPLNQPQPHQKATPAGRAYHAANFIRGNLVIAGGLGPNDTPLNDVWEYDLRVEGSAESPWNKVALQGSFRARFGAPSASTGGVMLMYGGYSDGRTMKASSILTDLVEIDIQSGEVSVLPDNDPGQDSEQAPGGRALHGSFIIGTRFLVACGLDKSGFYSDIWNSYNMVTQEWSRICVDGDCKKVRPFMARYGPVATAFNSSHAVFGFGTNFLFAFDLYWVHDIADSGFKITEISLTPKGGSTRRDFIRAGAAVVVIDTQMMVCGGTVDVIAGLLPPVRSLCYRIILAQGGAYGDVFFTGSSTDSAENMLLGSSMHYVLDALVVYGGLGGNGIAASASELSNQVLKFVIDPSSLCSEGETPPPACVLCGQGSRNVGTKPGAYCELANPGTYIVNPSQAALSCPAGTFSIDYGASDSSECIPCAVGTFQAATAKKKCNPCPAGKVCPIGTVEPLSSSSVRAKEMLEPFLDNESLATEVHPAAYKAPDIPPMPTIIVGGALFLVILVLLFIFCCGWRKKRGRLSHYFKDSDLESFRELFKHHATTSPLGITETEMMELFISESDHQSEGGSVLPKHHLCDPEHVHKLYRMVDVYRVGSIPVERFQEALIIAVAKGYMDPFPGTPSAQPGQRKLEEGCCSSLAALQLDDLDIFEDGHDLAGLGESRTYVRTQLGGWAACIGSVLLIGLVVSTTLDFMLSSIQETKSSVPYAVIQSSFTERPPIQIDTPFELQVTTFPLLRDLGDGISTISDACVKKGTADTCTGATSEALGIKSIDPNLGKLTSKTLGTKTCKYDDEDQSCTVTWKCASCYVDSSGNVTISTHPAFAAPVVKVMAKVGAAIYSSSQSFLGNIDPTGGPLLHSQFTGTIVPKSNTTLLSGFPASAVKVGLTPSYFESQKHSALWGSDNLHKTTGYHVQTNGMSALVAGNSIPPQLFSRKYDVPVRFDFTVTGSPLMIKRVLIRTLLDFFTGLLGAVSGFLAMVAAGLNWAEGRSFFMPNSDNVDEDAQEEAEQLEDREEEEGSSEGKYKLPVDDGSTTNNNKTSGDEEPHRPSPTEFARLKTLYDVGLPLTHAWAVNRAIDIALNPESSKAVAGVTALPGSRVASSATPTSIKTNETPGARPVAGGAGVATSQEMQPVVAKPTAAAAPAPRIPPRQVGTTPDGQQNATNDAAASAAAAGADAVDINNPASVGLKPEEGWRWLPERNMWYTASQGSGGMYFSHESGRYCDIAKSVWSEEDGSWPAEQNQETAW